MAYTALTKEAFAKIFYDNFKLANYIIKIAQDQIHAGNEELNVSDLLEEVRRNPPDELSILEKSGK